MISNVPSWQEVKERYLAKALPWQFGCWVCWRSKGKHIYAWPLAEYNFERYTIRIACDRCKRILQNKGIYFYN